MDNKIKEALNRVTEEYSPSDKVYDNILMELKGEKYMKKNIKKFAVCIAAAAVLLTAGVTAAGRIAYYAESGSDLRDLIDHAPTEQEVYDAAGYVPKYTDKLGDYSLVSALPGSGTYYDENNNELSSGKEISFDYEYEGKTLTLFTSNSPAQFEQTGDIAASEGDVDIYYSSFTNKFVPPDYEPTPEEEKQVEEGSLNIGYGSDEITISESEYVSWSDEGITYSILTMDNVLGKDVLVDMAMDIINS